MTVKELKDALATLPENAVVAIEEMNIDGDEYLKVISRAKLETARFKKGSEFFMDFAAKGKTIVLLK